MQIFSLSFALIPPLIVSLQLAIGMPPFYRPLKYGGFGTAQQRPFEKNDSLDDLFLSQSVAVVIGLMIGFAILVFLARISPILEFVGHFWIALISIYGIWQTRQLLRQGIKEQPSTFNGWLDLLISKGHFRLHQMFVERPMLLFDLWVGGVGLISLSVFV